MLNTGLDVSFRSFVDSYRMAAVKKLLEKSDAGIIETAFDCGFNFKKRL
jgi:AraC-like DNA-binding protein